METLYKMIKYNRYPVYCETLFPIFYNEEKSLKLNNWCRQKNKT